MYRESEKDGLLKIEISCDARKGSGICGNSAEVTMQERKAALLFLGNLGFALLRGHQVCGWCLRKKRVVFPRK